MSTKSAMPGPFEVCLGALDHDLDQGLLDEVIEAGDAWEKRRRLLPARTVLYFVLGLCAFSSGDSLKPPGYRMVMRWLVSGFGYLTGAAVPSAAALCKARQRLGVAPLRLLFARVRGFYAAPDTPGAFCCGRRLVSFDGTAIDAFDNTANRAAFGCVSSGGGNPQVRLMALIECGTHAVIDAIFGAAEATSEKRMAQQLTRAMRPGMLVLADRNFGAQLFSDIARGTGADLLWRVKSGTDYPVMKRLPDGSYVSMITTANHKNRFRTALRRGWPVPHLPGTKVRVIDYQITTNLANTVSVSDVRLITTLLDPDEAPANTLSQTYHQRWESENSYNELKTFLRGAGFVMRSQSPALVAQEIYALLVVYQLLCQLKHHASNAASVDNHRVSFTLTIRITRDTITTGQSLGLNARELAVAAIAANLNPPRRTRVSPRTKKPPKNTFPAKKHHHTRPPTKTDHTITIRAPATTP